MDRHLATLGLRDNERHGTTVLVENDGAVHDALYGIRLSAEDVAYYLVLTNRYRRNLAQALAKYEGVEYWYRQVSPTSWVAYVGSQAVAEATNESVLRFEISKLGLDVTAFQYDPLRIVRVV